jgi:hypothetical protein
MRHPLLHSALIFFAVGLLTRAVVKHHESRDQILALILLCITMEVLAQRVFGRPASLASVALNCFACAVGVLLMRYSMEGLSH